ncbi:unnamed protein product [Mytilus coruscus]|uniref:DUF6589 domain-containing protein n=1 Tax=Mytilus coruscus TaxID=42192 RepID=A0A6J8ABV6_MYTCO|nr:unnamed protein product [Mytilus coruscus]
MDDDWICSYVDYFSDSRLECSLDFKDESLAGGYVSLLILYGLKRKDFKTTIIMTTCKLEKKLEKDYEKNLYNGIVQIDYRQSKRKTNLQGPTKLACRALVMKQYKTALNHLLQIDEVKKKLVNTVKKTINQELNKVCSDKNSVLRSSNIARFSWKTVHKQLLNTCPTTVDLLKLLAGKKENNVPSVVSSLAILLFARNQQINTFQAINSVLMFRGHVRTKLCYPEDIETETKIEDTCIYTAEPLFESPIDHSRLDASESPDLSQENLHLPTPMKCGSYGSEDLLQTPACKTDLSIDMDSPFTTTIPVEASSESGPFQIVMDNLYLHQKNRHKTLDTSNKVHNLVHSIGIQHRVTTDLESLLPQADILSIPNEAFIPNKTDHDDLYSDFRILIQRALVTYIPELKDFRDLVTFHIEHQYSKTSEKKKVPLGILEKDENITEQMIEVVLHLQQYVPKTNDGKFIPILLGGDALSVERSEAASRARMDAITEEDRLEGFTWKSEDWHEHVFSLQVSSAVNDDREFVRFATQGYAVLAAFEVLNINSADELNVHIENLKTNEQKKTFLEKLSSDIVKRTSCGFPGCPTTFSIDGRCRQRHRETCHYQTLEILDVGHIESIHEEKETHTKTTKQEDKKFNYSCCLLREGLMDWCREDAAKENDGDRLVRMWRFDMLRFSYTNHTKYRLLAFKLQAQLLATLPPKMAHELKYNRTVNIHGGPSGNIPCDLALEFMNMRAKDGLTGLRGNLTSTAIQRCGRSLQGCNYLIDGYTKGLQQFFGKPANSKPSIQRDISKLVDSLKDEKLFDRIPGRSHRSFMP